MSDDEGSERQRRLQVLTPTSAEIAEAMLHAQRLQQRHDRAQANDDLFIELFGRDGKGGRFTALEKTVDNHTQTLSVLTEFKVRLMIYGTIVLAIGGVIAGFAFKVIDHYWK